MIVRSHITHALLPFIIALLPTVLSDEQCSPRAYAAAASPGMHDEPLLAGATRSTTKPNSFTLLTPNARVYASPPPGWQGAVKAAAVVTPALGAHFSMYLVDVTGEASLSEPVTFPDSSPSLERLFYILVGQIQVQNATDDTKTVHTPGGFLYVAPGDTAMSITSSSASLIQIDRIHARPATPRSAQGSESEIAPEICDGEVFRLRRLLNASDPALDFNIHVMDFHPGEYLNVKEVHYNQHGLLMLQGHGIYRLDDVFIPVGTGDIIYMAPFVPQWYGALGKETSRYFLYKDTNVDPLDGPAFVSRAGGTPERR